MTVWAFWNQSFLMKSNNSFPQWAYLILRNLTSVEAYFCPHTKPNKDKFLILCSDLCIETMSLLWQKWKQEYVSKSFFFLFFFSLNWPQNCPSTTTACRDSVNKTWIKQLICVKYWEKKYIFQKHWYKAPANPYAFVVCLHFHREYSSAEMSFCTCSGKSSPAYIHVSGK